MYPIQVIIIKVRTVGVLDSDGIGPAAGEYSQKGVCWESIEEIT
jgi:hypothetical protein